jgi:uncharacterized protein YodC (DUF2158 family)
MPDELKVGAVVELKSGGPSMTVARLESMNGVPVAVCDWFTDTKPERSTFPITSLQLAE